MPPAEQILWKILRNSQLKGYKFRRQHGIGNFIVDFYCPKVRLGIEVDGESHHLSNNSIRDDVDRDNFLRNNNIKILRLLNSDVYNNLEGVIEKISKELS